MAVPTFVDRVTLHVSAGRGGNGVGRGGDDTLFALVGGNVEFGTRRGRKVVNIVPTAE